MGEWEVVGGWGAAGANGEVEWTEGKRRTIEDFEGTDKTTDSISYGSFTWLKQTNRKTDR